MKRLFLMRHGLSQANLDEVFAGTMDTPLVDTGREQARAAGEQAKNLHIDLIICSPLGRTRETAEIVAGTIGYPLDKIEQNALLVERGLGELQGKPFGTSSAEIARYNIEPLEHLLNRATEMYDYCKQLPADNILLVSHGTFALALQHIIDHPDLPYAEGPELPNAQIVQLI